MESVNKIPDSPAFQRLRVGIEQPGDVSLDTYRFQFKPAGDGSANIYLHPPELGQEDTFDAYRDADWTILEAGYDDGTRVGTGFELLVYSDTEGGNDSVSIRADYLHRVSKALVREAIENDCTAIAFENLKHIRKRISNGSKFQQWAFRELQRHVEYKAEEHGIDVDDVKPQYTSQRCSHSECGFTHEDNRNGDEFECLKCGKELHSDYNAARNVGWRLIQHWLKSGAGRATSQLALKSGTVNANGQFRPTALRS